MKLEELVPPLELCKLIPKGEFEDSVFCWIDKGHACIIPTDRIYPEAMPFIELRRYTVQGDDIPAPTLEEIMEKLPPCACASDHLGWCAASHYIGNNFPKFASNGVTAVLKLWFKWKGIDVQKTENFEQ